MSTGCDSALIAFPICASALLLSAAIGMVTANWPYRITLVIVRPVIKSSTCSVVVNDPSSNAFHAIFLFCTSVE